MRTRTKILLVGAAVAGAAAIPAIASAGNGSSSDGNEVDVPITGPALEEVSNAALDYIGEGRVTETEVGDEESLYEVEVTLDDGSQVDVQLDEQFNVVGTEEDEAGADD